MPSPPTIGRAELEILNYIHDHHPVPVRQVAEHVSATKGHTRTTVLNVIARLTGKGYLTRKRVGGVYHYSPRVAKADLLRRLVGDFVDKALGGSLSPFVAYLTRDARLSEDDVRELRRLVDELDAARADEPRRTPQQPPQRGAQSEGKS
jgi:predicted transcriptional regulator